MISRSSDTYSEIDSLALFLSALLPKEQNTLTLSESLP